MDRRTSVTEWQLTGGPFDGETWRAWPGREIRKPVVTAGGEMGDVIYTPYDVYDGVILARYEGFEKRECPCEECRKARA